MSQKRNKLFSSLILIFSLLFIFLLLARDKTAKKPVIFILVDTLRADYLGAYGFNGNVSPHIDALAAESILFQSARSHAPTTPPSIISLMTSLYPDSVVARKKNSLKNRTEETGTIPLNLTTMAEAFKNQGYQTAGFVENIWLLSKFGFSQGFDEYQEVKNPQLGGDHNAERVFGRVVQWLDKREKEKPFFLYVHLMDVHGPYQCDEKDYNALKNSSSFPKDRVLQAREVERRPDYLGKWSPWASLKEKSRLRFWPACYAAGIKKFDQRFGDFLSSLKERDLFDQSILIFTSDHGEQFLEHGGWDHGSNLHFHQTHVPFLVRLPKKKKAGIKVTSLVSLIDIMPTLIGLTGISYEGQKMEGRDLSQVILGKAPESEFISYASSFVQGEFLQSFEDGKYKIIKNYYRKKFSLYDKINDSKEKKNIVKKNSNVAQKYHSLLVKHFDQILKRQKEIGAQTKKISKELQEGLRSLGYLQ